MHRSLFVRQMSRILSRPVSVVPSSLLAAATSAWWWRWLVVRTAVVASRATSGVSECWRGGQGQRGPRAAAQRTCASCNHPPSIAMKTLHRSASLQQPRIEAPAFGQHKVFRFLPLALQHVLWTLANEAGGRRGYRARSDAGAPRACGRRGPYPTVLGRRRRQPRAPGDASPTHGRRNGPDGSRVGYLALVTGLPRSGNLTAVGFAARSSARAIRVPVGTAGSGLPRSFTVREAPSELRVRP
jgi:hypothetical protein